MGKHERFNELKMLAEHEFSHRFNHTLHAYIDIAGDLVAGTLLSQIMYWFTPNSNGERKVKVLKDGHYWIAKRQEDWYQEIRITEKQYRTAIKKLEDKKLVIKKRYKFDGSPTTHIRPNYPVLQEEIEKWKHAVMKEIEEKNITDTPNLTKGQKPVKSSTSETKQDKKTSIPAELLDFDQRAKSNLTKGQNRNLPSGKNHNRDYDKDNYKQQQTEKNVVVVEAQKQFEKLFNKALPTKTAEEFSKMAEENGKDLIDCIERTKKYLDTQKSVKNPIGALRYEVTNGWDIEESETEDPIEKEKRRKENHEVMKSIEEMLKQEDQALLNMTKEEEVSIDQILRKVGGDF
jgi:hypothetical protein